MGGCVQRTEVEATFASFADLNLEGAHRQHRQQRHYRISRSLIELLPRNAPKTFDHQLFGRCDFPQQISTLFWLGATEGQSGLSRTLPKILLSSKLDALMATGCLKIQADLPEADTLIRELRDYRVQFTPSGQLTANARQGQHDDLVLATALAIWRLAGGGMASWGLYETYRQQAAALAGADPERLVIGLDLGQKGDFSALVVARRLVLFPDEFAAMGPGPNQPMGGGIIDLPNPISQPDSTAQPPDVATAEWQHEVAEGVKAAVRGEGFSTGGPLKATATFAPNLWRRTDDA
jgi:hypothetical protein